jgi:hypothetical protein
LGDPSMHVMQSFGGTLTEKPLKLRVYPNDISQPCPSLRLTT